MENQKKLGAAAFLPLIVFLALYVGCGITFTLMGMEDPFGQFPRHVALLAGVAVALLLAPKVKVSEKLDVFCQSMGNSGVMMIVLIYLMAGGFQGAAATMGGKDSVINIRAVDAAGTIHSDLARGFIRAQVVAFDDYMAHAHSFDECRKAGVLRLEGKEYIVKDGDMIEIRFNV